MGYAESMVRTMLAQTVGETETLNKAVEHRQVDLSGREDRDFVGRLIANQVRALYFLASQIDDLKAAGAR